MMFVADRRLAVLLLFAICLSCKPAQEEPKKTPDAVPQVRAIVVGIRTIAVGAKKSEYDIIIYGDLARSTGEVDTWRLFDTKLNTVTFVDDVERTIRTEPVAEIVKRRKATLAASLPSHYPQAEVRRTKERQQLHHVTAEQTVITAGAYRRELWLADHPQIPRGLFAMMLASDTQASPLAPMMRSVDEVLLRERGFPFLDRTEVPFGGEKMVVERMVTGIAQRDVPQSLFALPKNYKDLTPKPAAPQQ